MELNAIKSKGNWGEMAADLNANFAAVTAELEKLKATNVKFKGYFTSEKTLMASFPSPSPGDTAWVGEVYPGTVYECKATGTWSNTGKIPSTPSVQLADYARKELVNSRTTEYNVSVQHPTSGIDGSNKYILEGAIAQVPPELRNIGLKVSFVNLDGKVETWEFQGDNFMNVGNWANKNVSTANVIQRTGYYQIDKYIKEFYIKNPANITSVRIIGLYSNVNGKNQVDVLINGKNFVSIEGTSEDTLLVSDNYFCVVDFSNFHNYYYEAEVILGIAKNLNLNPSIRDYLGTKNFVDKKEYSRLVGSFIIEEKKDISTPNATCYLPYEFIEGSIFDVELIFSQPLTSPNVLICTSSKKSLSEESRMDILFAGKLVDSKKLTYTLQVNKAACFFTFYTQSESEDVLIKIGNFKKSDIGEIKTDISSMKVDIENLKNESGDTSNDGSLYFLNKKWKADEIVTCGYNRNYSSLYAAMQYARTKAKKNYIIEVQLYSDIVMHDDSQLQLSDKYEGSEQYRCICNIPPYVRLRGIGDKKIISLILSKNSYAQSMTETLHVDGNSELENIHVIGYNLRYPIHFERGNNPPNVDSVVRLYNVDITHHGASHWQSPEAWGSGNASGMNVFMYGCRLIANFDTLFAHNWNGLSLPIGYHLYHCSIMNIGEQKVAVHFQNNGTSKQPYIIELIGNNIDGYVKLTAADYYKLVKPSITGYGNSPHYFRNEMNMENIRIRTVQTGVAQSIVEISGIGEKYLGNVRYGMGAVGRYPFIYWDNNLSALSGNNETLLGKRLGNCSEDTKTLTISVNGEEISIAFNKDYTDYSNQRMVDEINSQLKGKAVAELYQPLAGYYEELSDVLFNINVPNILSKGCFVKKGKSYAMLIDDALSSGTMVRAIKNCIVSKSDQFAPLFEEGADVFVAEDRFSVSEKGKLFKDANGFIIAIDNDKIFIE